MNRLYRAVLRLLRMAEQRCAWCGSWLGFIRGTRGHTSHGICAACAREHFGSVGA